MATIAIDVMGGDYAPRVVIDGVHEALRELPGDFDLLLVGDEHRVEEEVSRVGLSRSERLRIVHAPEVVQMDESPASAVRSKKKSSINIAVDLVKQGEAQAVISAGHTGAAVASTVLKLRTLPGVERPGLGTVFPSSDGRFVLLDVGANVDCKAKHLVQYAIMGDVYERKVLGKANPRIGLLSIGDENTKGNDLTKETFKLLQKIPDINFIGNVEGHDLFSGRVDVVVCDGFVGNVVLKCSESLAHEIGQMLRENLSKSVFRKIGYLLSRNAFRELKQSCDPAESGGAPLFGINGVCIIGHGSSNSRAIRNAIRVANESVEHQVNKHIVDRINSIDFAELQASE